MSGFATEGDHATPTQLLDEAAVEYEDDDYYDVNSDEEMLDDNVVLASDLTAIAHLSRTISKFSMKAYDVFLYDGILDHYRPERVANPLRNPKTARVFAHFIHATGPSISMFERNSGHHLAELYGRRSPAHSSAPMSFFTHTIPMEALNHQNLLHAVLALSSLHIARLQGASFTPSYKHCAYALKKLHRCLGDAKERLQPHTLATALLLAFYEVWIAEHTNWGRHLVGARELLAELNFPRMTREARRLKSVKQQCFTSGMLVGQNRSQERHQAESLVLDESLLSHILGQQVRYDDFGTVIDESESERAKTNPLDLKTFDLFQDLYWWYIRQDCLQSLISGNPLM